MHVPLGGAPGSFVLPHEEDKDGNERAGGGLLCARASEATSKSGTADLARQSTRELAPLQSEAKRNCAVARAQERAIITHSARDLQEGERVAAQRDQGTKPVPECRIRRLLTPGD